MKITIRAITSQQWNLAFTDPAGFQVVHDGTYSNTILKRFNSNHGIFSKLLNIVIIENHIIM